MESIRPVFPETQAVIELLNEPNHSDHFNDISYNPIPIDHPEYRHAMREKLRSSGLLLRTFDWFLEQGVGKINTESINVSYNRYGVAGGQILLNRDVHCDGSYVETLSFSSHDAYCGTMTFPEASRVDVERAKPCYSTNFASVTPEGEFQIHTTAEARILGKIVAGKAGEFISIPTSLYHAKPPLTPLSSRLLFQRRVFGRNQ